MKFSKHELKSFKNAVLSAAIVIGVSTLAFQGITHVTAEAEYNKKKMVPTSYTNVENQYSVTLQNLDLKGYKRANYTVETMDLEFYKKQTPTNSDITKEEAAEIGAQALWSIFGVNLEGQVIEMGYTPANENYPRSIWTGYINLNNEHIYGFTLDSLTGELFSVGKERTLKENVSVDFNIALDQNPEEFKEHAKKIAEELNVVQGPVSSVEYHGQGYSNNDPTIQLEVKGENGMFAFMSFSRYDKALLTISFDTDYRYTLEQIEKIEKMIQSIESENLSSSTNDNGESKLIPYLEQ